MNNKMITIPYADAIEYGENTSALFKALWELTDLIRLESDLKKHHRAYLHVREDIDEKVKEARQIMTKVAVGYDRLLLQMLMFLSVATTMRIPLSLTRVMMKPFLSPRASMS